MFIQKVSKLLSVYVLGSLLLIFSSVLLLLSHHFDAEAVSVDPVLLLVTVLFASSVVYILAVNFRSEVFNVLNERKALFYIFAVGFLLRALMLFSAPMLEDDYFRYLWDGAVTAHGINPYRYSPEQILDGKVQVPELELLSRGSGDIIENINHGHLPTIYPPVSQMFFAVSYKLAPLDFDLWRVFLLLFDLTTFFLLLTILRELGLSSANVMIYWWNPLLINVTFNSGHFEALVFPFVLSALLLAYKKRSVLSTLALAAGVGIKLWPVVLLPSLLRSCGNKVMDVVRPALVFFILLFVIFLPLISVSPEGLSGFAAYGRSWENNSLFFQVILSVLKGVISTMGFDHQHLQISARIIVSAILLVWILFQVVKYDMSRQDMFKRTLFIVAAVFLLSPTQFPWYYTWLLPFLAVVPRFSLLVLTPQLTLYYLWFYLEPRGMEDLFRNVVVWIEFLPVWVLLIAEYRKGKLLRNF